MAILDVVAVHAHLLRMTLTNDEGSTDYDLEQDDLVDACVEGPLQNLFANPLSEPVPPGSSAWANLVSDGRLTIHSAGGDGRGTSDGAGGFRFIAGTPNILRLTLSGSAAVFELRYNHSGVR